MAKQNKYIRAVLLLAALLFPFAVSGCSVPAWTGEDTYLIGVSQANMREPWRLMLKKELEEEADKHGNIRLVFTDATQSSEKQVKDIERLMEYGVDLLIVSPCDVAQLTPAIGKVYGQIPVIVLDRAVEGYDYSLFIGPDNSLIGSQAGQEVLKLAGGKPARVLEICGSSASPASLERTRGFRQEIEKQPNISLSQIVVENESRDGAEDALLSMVTELGQIDIVFAHNDYMALGAVRAAEKRQDSHFMIVGIDGFSGPDGGLELIRSGAIDVTITCPTGGREAIQFSLDLLNKASGIPKQVILRSQSITKANVESYERSLTKSTQAPEKTIRVGYAQVGTESAWRLANNDSIIKAAKDFGIELTTVDANQSQEKQVEAIRSFIREKVDVIVISPIIDSGWDEVLKEAKQAGIPVLLSDRKISVKDPSLFETFIGADFMEEGRRAMRWVIKNVSTQAHPVRIMEIQGTTGASPTLERKLGFEAVLSGAAGYQMVHSATGDFTLEGGYQVVQQYLQLNSWDIDVIFAHNDDMALGAVKALEEHGLHPGKDIKIVSVDGTKAALEAVLTGKINCVVECSPLLGPQLMKVITDLKSGKELPLRIITDEKVFTLENTRQEIGRRSY